MADVQIGGEMTLISPATGAMRLRVKSTMEKGRTMKVATTHGSMLRKPAGWDGISIPTTAMATPSPIVTRIGRPQRWLYRVNATTMPRRFHKWIEWNTTSEKTSADPEGTYAPSGPLQAGKLLNHNASHTVERHCYMNGGVCVWDVVLKDAPANQETLTTWHAQRISVKLTVTKIIEARSDASARFFRVVIRQSPF